MKRLGLVLALSIAASAPLAAQGPAPLGISSRPVAPLMAPAPNRIVVAPSGGGMTRSERGALIGAIIGIVAGAALSAHYDEKSFSSMASAGIVMAIPASLVGALIGMM
jgi:hypothetical protein